MYNKMHHKLSMLVVNLLPISLMAAAGNEKLKCDPDIPSRIPPYYKLKGSRSGKPCGEGEYQDGFKCTPCDTGTFRTKQMAELSYVSRCEQCLIPDQHEVVEQFCNATRDTSILCVFGFYRYQVPENPCNSRCERCTICGVGQALFDNHEARKCNTYNDTVCCSDLDMNVLDGQCLPKVTSTSPSWTTTEAVTTATNEVLTSLNISTSKTSALRPVKSRATDPFNLTDFGLFIILALTFCF